MAKRRTKRNVQRTKRNVRRTKRNVQRTKRNVRRRTRKAGMFPSKDMIASQRDAFSEASNDKFPPELLDRIMASITKSNAEDFAEQLKQKIEELTPVPLPIRRFRGFHGNPSADASWHYP